MSLFKLFPALSFVLIFFTSCRQQAHVQSLKGPIANKFMISSAHPLASAIGVEIMKDGGNAIDAAIAVNFALAVVYPQAGNIGGGGFAVIRMNDGTVSSLDFREKAPALAYREMYLNGNGQIHTQLNTHGHLASGVPGTVDGMLSLIHI